MPNQIPSWMANDIPLGPAVTELPPWMAGDIPLGPETPEPGLLNWPEPTPKEQLQQSWQIIERERALAEAHRQLAASPLPGYLAFGVTTGADIISPVARIVGKGKYADAINRWANAIEVAQQERERGGTIPDFLERGIRGAARSIVPMTVAGRIGGPYASIGTAAVQEANRAITQGRDAGLKGGDLAAYAISQGVIEAVPATVMQKLGLGGAETLASTKQWMSKGIKHTLAKLGIGLAEELPEELVTEISHNIAAKVSSVDPQALTWESLGRTVADTTTQTTITILGLGGTRIAVGLGDIQIRQEIINAAKEDQPISRKQWARWGLPKEITKAEERADAVKAIAINLEAEEELIRRGEPQAPPPEVPAEPLVTPSEIQIEPTEAQPPGETVPPVTSIKNEIVDELRAQRETTQIQPAEAEYTTQWLGQAEQRILDDPTLPDRLIKELSENPRPIDDIETATLQIRYRHLNDAFAKAHDRLVAAQESGDTVEQERAQADANTQLKYLSDMEEKVLRPAGTEWGRAGVARQIMLKEDMSPVAMARKLRVAKGGQELTATELSKIAELNKRIKSLEDKLAKNITQRQRLTTEEKRTEAYKRSLKRRITEWRRRTTEKDFTKKEPKKTVLDKEAIDLRMELQQAKAEFKTMQLAAEWAQKPIHEKGIAQLHEALNASRAILTSVDFSALLRQGALPSYSHPIIAIKNVPAMFKAFWSERGAFEVMEELRSRKNWPLYLQAKLAITEIGGALSRQEEIFMGKWAPSIPVVRMFGQAYTMFLNRMRADVFDSLATTLGQNSEVTLDEARMIANLVNVISGRGGLGRAEQAATLMATYFFAPRYVASRFQFLAGMPIWQSKGRIRGLIAREYAHILIGWGTFTGLLLGLFGFFKDEDEPEPTATFNPLSSDFGKIRISNTRLDPMAGLSQTTVFVSRLLAGRTRTAKGKIVPIRGEGRPYQGLSTKDVLANFLRSKLSPVIGTAVDIAAGENIVGEPATPQSIARGILFPLAISDILKSLQEEHGLSRQQAIALLAIFGVSAQTYSSTTPGHFAEEIAAHGRLSGRTKEGKAYDYTSNIATVVTEARRLGYTEDQMLSELDDRLQIRGFKSSRRQLYRRRFIQRWNAF